MLRLALASLGPQLVPVEPGAQGQALRRLVVDGRVGRLRASVGRRSCCCPACNGVGLRYAGSLARRLPPWACPLSVSGIDRIPHGRAIVMFNHASYADAIILSAVLPYEPTYLAKKELAGQFFAGNVLRRLGALFLERYDLSGSLADTAVATDAARQGRLLVIFPEGTFTRRPGLLGFHLAPFKIACEAGLPVFPGVLRGTRSMLRADQWFPRWAPISVEVAAADQAVRHRLRLGVEAPRRRESRHPGQLRRAGSWRADEAHTHVCFVVDFLADQPTASAVVHTMPSVLKLSRVAAIEPSTSMPRQASSTTTTSKPSRYASSAE